MANHDAHHDGHGHDHDHTEGNRQYYPKGWWIPLVALVIFAIGFAGLGGWLFSLSGTDRWGKHSESDEHGHGTHVQMAAHADHHGEQEANKEKEAAAPVLDSGMVMTKLGESVEISGNINGIETQLVGFISDAAKPVDKTTWFTFDRLVFESGKANLDLTNAGTVAQLDNMAAILKAFPAVGLKIGGYTDNSGNKAANQTLSQKRAESVMAEIVKRGIAADRLAAEGYGDQFPKADNATEEGRAQNRRIDVRVTTK